ncbi:MAG: hypothetical protein H6623_05360 [Bdellovibrionaceae bacterium]|nr:hypothetical protein [Pseudobdellovibrionaceae bacterium]
MSKYKKLFRPQKINTLLVFLFSLLFTNIVYINPAMADFPDDCWKARNALLDWTTQPHLRSEHINIRLTTLKDIETFKKKCKREIKDFPDLKEIFKKVPEEIASTENYLREQEEIQRKENSDECKILNKRREYCNYAVMVMHVRRYPNLIAGMSPQGWFLNMEQKKEAINIELKSKGVNPSTDAMCEIIEENQRGRIVEVYRKPSDTTKKLVCGR